METINGCIVSYAFDDIGQEEIKGNMGFKDAQFDRDMRELGRFQNGWAWCVCFCEKIWKQSFRDFNIDKGIYNEMAKLVTAGAVKTFRNFTKADGWVVSKTPVVGAIVIWQKYKGGKGTTSGHAGIVIEIHDYYIVVVEGNTNKAGGREGIGVFEKKRKFNFESTSGLRMLGFIHPKTT